MTHRERDHEPIRALHAEPLLEASPNAIVAVDATGRVVYANPHTKATFGYPRNELIGMPIERLLPERIRASHVALRTGYMEHPSVRPMGIGLDLVGERRDGTEFPVEISLTPVDTPEGRIVYATVVDITARKATEAALGHSERRFRAVLEASPNSIVAVNDRGDIVYVNAQTERTFGYGTDELLGLPIGTLIPDRVRVRHLGHRLRFFEHPGARPMGIGLDLAGRHKDGTEFPVEISLSPVETGEGLQVFATVVDITARKSLEGQLLQAQKMESIGRLAGGIAHDFNNMLSAIRGYAELLLADIAASPYGALDAVSSERGVSEIRNASERAATLTAQLLAFSRQQVLSPKVLEMREVILSIEPMIRRLVGEQVRLTLGLDPATGRVRADPGQLDQILVNLVVNARDAMPGGGLITIETSNTTMTETYTAEHFEVTPGQYVMLAVSDSGIGMDRATREHIFEPFFTTKDRGKGTGLGLATIYGIVRQSGGHIWLYSEPGIGTTFKLYFPRVDAPVEGAAPPRPALVGTGSGTILLVEDEEVVRDLTLLVLERAGYTVLVAEDARQALDALDRFGPTVRALVTDVVMPGMPGPELARQALERHPGLAVVLLSGYMPDTLDIGDLLKRGAQFVGKPFAPDDLALAVAESLRSPQNSA